MNPFKIIFLLLISHSAISQIELWGMTSQGGYFNAGTVFKYKPDSNEHEVLYSFKDYENTPIIRNLIKCSNGKYYGISDSGYKGFGSIWEYNYDLNQFTLVYNFGDGPGERCNKGLVEAGNGLLYGVTSNGGTFNQGLLFSFDPNTYTFVKLFDFNELSFPIGNLFCSQENILYGTTSVGGVYDNGTAYKFDINTGTYSKIHDFNGSIDGSTPGRELTLGANGNLYSFSRADGAFNLGTIFEINLLTNTFSKKIDLDNSIGMNPIEKLTLANDGNFYGVCQRGGANGVGAIFQYNANLNQLSKKMDIINGNINGGSPYSGFLLGSDGFLYSTTLSALNQYDYLNNVYTKKIDFIQNSGINNKNLFINSINGKILGINISGIDRFLFEYDLSSNVLTNKYTFIGGLNGLNPTGSLLKATDGNFYGMTPYGGNYDNGIIFRINPVSKLFKKIFDFDRINGQNPFGSLTESENGNLYGLTYEGGVNLNYGGVLFKYNIQTSTFTKILDFTVNLNHYGSFPSGTLTKGLGTKMYAASKSGIGIGNIFEFDTNTETAINLAGFSGSYDGYPYDSPFLSSNGKFYGLTSGENDFSPNSQGYLYEYNRQNNTITPKINFLSQIGNAQPKGRLIEAKDKSLYGLTFYGGINPFGNGVLFKYSPESNIFTNLHSFNGSTDGRYPSGTPLEASNGNIYGLTRYGGIHDFGVIFKYNPSLNSFSKIFDFNILDGAFPIYTQLTERIATISTTKSGNWNDPTVWENGIVPSNSSYITINSNHIIDIDGMPVAIKYVEVKGTINFLNGGSLNMVE